MQRKVKLMKKQSTLFPEKEKVVLTELDLDEAQRLADQVKCAVAIHCDKVEVAGSIRRQRVKVHDIDFVVVTKTDAEWLKIVEELKRLKARLNCAGNSVIKAFLPCREGLFQVDFYRAKQETFGIHLIIRTGSADHNMWLAGFAISKGMRLKYSQGLLKEDKVVAGADEKAVFEALGILWRAPLEREIVDGKPVWQPVEEAQVYEKICKGIKEKS
jgi:DNA polymerase/3'-5' exonuclease PolX